MVEFGEMTLISKAIVSHVLILFTVISFYAQLVAELRSQRFKEWASFSTVHISRHSASIPGQKKFPHLSRISSQISAGLMGFVNMG